jgi:hypothetical protein
MNDLKNILKSGRILMYGYNNKNLPDNISESLSKNTDNLSNFIRGI